MDYGLILEYSMDEHDNLVITVRNMDGKKIINVFTGKIAKGIALLLTTKWEKEIKK